MSCSEGQEEACSSRLEGVVGMTVRVEDGREGSSVAGLESLNVKVSQ